MWPYPMGSYVPLRAPLWPYMALFDILHSAQCLGGDQSEVPDLDGTDHHCTELTITDPEGHAFHVRILY